MKVAINGMLLSRLQSGVELSVLQLVRALARGGSEQYRFYVPADFPGDPPSGPSCRSVRTRVPARMRVLRILWEQLVLPRVLAREQVALLHAPAYVAPIWSPVPVVLTVYDVIALLLPRLCRSSNVPHYRLFLPLSVKRAAGIVVPSEVTRRDLVSQVPAAAGKVRVIPLGLDDAFRAPHDDAAVAAMRATCGLGAPFILCVARQEPKKNIPVLLEAFALLKRETGLPHRLVLVGADAWGTRAVSARIRALGLADAVVRPGFVPADELPLVYAAADLFVFPSLYEGFGLPPLEAMAAGVPVVASTRGALPEVLGDAAVLCDPLDVAGLARSMRRALEDKELRATLRAKGRARAALYTWERCAAATESFYRECAGTAAVRSSKEASA